MVDESKEIPIRRVSITSESQWMAIPNNIRATLGTTPNGNHMYGTTPGGTRIVYDRIYLLQAKNSPLSRTPPDLPLIPGVTTDLGGLITSEDDCRKTSSESNPMQTIEEKEELANGNITGDSLNPTGGEGEKDVNDNEISGQIDDNGAYDDESDNDIEMEM